MANRNPKQPRLLGAFFSEADLRRLGTAWRRHREGFPPNSNDDDLVELMCLHEELKPEWDALMMAEMGKGRLKVPETLFRRLLQILMEASLKDSIAANKPPWIKRLYDELTLKGMKEVDALSALMWALAKERMRSRKTRTRVKPQNVEALARRWAKDDR